MTAGLAIGASSHAVGTSKALELGETEGAMSGLAIGVCCIRKACGKFQRNICRKHPATP